MDEVASYCNNRKTKKFSDYFAIKRCKYNYAKAVQGDINGKTPTDKAIHYYAFCNMALIKFCDDCKNINILYELSKTIVSDYNNPNGKFERLFDRIKNKQEYLGHSFVANIGKYVNDILEDYKKLVGNLFQYNIFKSLTHFKSCLKKAQRKGTSTSTYLTEDTYTYDYLINKINIFLKTLYSFLKEFLKEDAVKDKDETLIGTRENVDEDEVLSSGGRYSKKRIRVKRLSKKNKYI